MFYFYCFLFTWKSLERWSCNQGKNGQEALTVQWQFNHRFSAVIWCTLGFIGPIVIRLMLLKWRRRSVYMFITLAWNRKCEMVLMHSINDILWAKLSALATISNVCRTNGASSTSSSQNQQFILLLMAFDETNNFISNPIAMWITYHLHILTQNQWNSLWAINIIAFSISLGILSCCKRFNFNSHIEIVFIYGIFSLLESRGVDSLLNDFHWMSKELRSTSKISHLPANDFDT